MKNKSSEKGQVLIMIAFAMIVLTGFAALAIDGSNVFSDRRHAQNAADTAVLAATLAKTRGQSYSTAGLDRASSNGYDNDLTTNIVEIYNPPIDGNYAGNSEYVQVKIISHVSTYFARVLGVSLVTNRVEAVARSIPGYSTSLFGGNALVALNKTACPALDFKGSSTTTVQGSGIFVNSGCASGSNQAFNASTGSGTFNTPCVNIVGGITLGTNTTFNSPGTSCANRTNNSSMQIANPLATFASANIPCGTANGTLNGNTLTPGNYTGAFPPAGAKFMDPGIYCIDAGNQSFSLQGGKTLTGDNVLIYMKKGGVNWTSGGIRLSAIQAIDPATGEKYIYSGLLLYLPPGNCSDVSITGNGDSNYIGTILAPCSNVKLAGGSSGATEFQNQIISDTITITGSSSLKIIFDREQNWQPPIPPAIEMTQ